MIKDKHMPALQGMFPSWITSCSSDGEPNTTVISQIWYVDMKLQAIASMTGMTGIFKLRAADVYKVISIS